MATAMKNLFAVLARMLIPALIVEGLLLLLWLFEHSQLDYPRAAPPLLLLFNTLALPVLLIAGASRGLRRHRDVHPLWGMLSAWLAVGLAHGAAYLMWGVTSGNLLTPDWGTALITRLAVMAALGLVSLASFVWLFLRWPPSERSPLVPASALLVLAAAGRLFVSYIAPDRSPVLPPMPIALRVLTPTVDLAPGGSREVQIEISNQTDAAQLCTLSASSPGGVSVNVPGGGQLPVAGHSVARTAVVVTVPADVRPGTVLASMVQVSSAPPTYMAQALITVRVGDASGHFQLPPTVRPAPAYPSPMMEAPPPAPAYPYPSPRQAPAP